MPHPSRKVKNEPEGGSDISLDFRDKAVTHGQKGRGCTKGPRAEGVRPLPQWAWKAGLYPDGPGGQSIELKQIILQP